MAQILVIGYGHPFKDDNSLGWQVARHLETADLAANIEVLTRRLLLPELAAKISCSDLVIFVDRVAEGEPGAIICQPISADSALYPVFSHQYDPLAFLSWVQHFYGYQPPAFVVSLVGPGVDRGQHMPSKLQFALPHLLDRIRFLIKYNLIQLESRLTKRSKAQTLTEHGEPL